MRTGLTISAIGHAILLLWGALSFSAQPLITVPPDSLPVDIISAKEFSQLMAGNKNAPKAEALKPLVDKVAELKPAKEVVPNIADKPEIKPLPAAAQPEPKPPEPKPSEAKSDKPTPAKPDPIAEALKKEDAKRAAEAKAKAKAAAAKKPQPTFNPDQIAAMLDKRDPQRMAATGDTVNSNPTLGLASGSAPMLSQSEVDALRARLIQLWNPPAGVQNPQELVVKIRIQLSRDGKLAGPPMVLTSGRGSIFEAARDGAVRALYRGQPYEMLRPEHYDLWKEMEITFDPREMSPG